MVMTRIIPCLDVRDGRVVKGVRFQGLRDVGDPVERALSYEQQGNCNVSEIEFCFNSILGKTKIIFINRVVFILNFYIPV